jgi:anti-sigma B factor antagonist
VVDKGVSTSTLAIAVRRDGERTVLALTGELDLHTRDALIRATVLALDDPLPLLEFDASGLTFCDSSGMSAFLAVRNIAEEHEARVVLTRPSDQVRALLRVSGLHQLLTGEPVDE